VGVVMVPDGTLKKLEPMLKYLHARQKQTKPHDKLDTV
jgi:hypothetical protein